MKIMEDACEQMIITTNSVCHGDHGYITKNLRSGYYVNMQQMCLPWLFTFLSSCMVSCPVGLAWVGYWLLACLESKPKIRVAPTFYR